MDRHVPAASAAAAPVPAPDPARDFPKTTALPAHLVHPNMARALPGDDAVAVHETVTRIYLAEDSRNAGALRALVTEELVQEHAVVRDRLRKAGGRWRIARRIYDQFAIPAVVLAPRETRLDVARTLPADAAS